MTGSSRQVILPQEMMKILILLFFSRFSVLLAYEQAILLLDRLIRLNVFSQFHHLCIHCPLLLSQSVGIIKRKNTQSSLSSLVSHHF